ncbi:peptidoglycan DD-metalloendopeptidase family protein [Brevibacterium yomogidense]|uniref:peptidoglycan DD-metalloendopeptidase family protein n=1 Tax=Brevibacterium yomogidense TaxID=946573 RepID=UPI002FCD0E53
MFVSPQLPTRHQSAVGVRRRVLALLAIVLALVLCAPMTPALANPTEEKSAVDERVEELQQEHEGLTEELARVVAEMEAAEEKMPDAEDAVSEASDELEEAQRKDEELGARLTSAENAEKDLREEIDEGADQIEDSEKSVVGVARRAYQNSGVTSDVAMLLQMAESDSGMDGLTRVDSAVRSQQRTITRLGERRAANISNQNRLDAIADEISDLKDEAAEVVLAKESAERAARDAKDELDSLISQKDSAAKTIEENQASTAEELEKQKEEQERLADQIREWQEDNGDGNRTLPGDGFLKNPAPGYPITSHYGWRTHPIAGVRRLHSGTDFGVPCGTEVHASADGVVVSSGGAGGYGNRVVISHGKSNGASIATTYNHNTRNLVRAGQSVKQGDAISISGTTGASTGCHLHFEVMQNGSYVNPMDWIS